MMGGPSQTYGTAPQTQAPAPEMLPPLPKLMPGEEGYFPPNAIMAAVME